MFKNKKGGMSVSIVLLVVLTLILSVVLLGAFSSQSRNTSEDFGHYLYLDSLKKDARVLNFNLAKSLDAALISDDFEGTLDSRIELMEELFDDSNFVILSRDIEIDAESYEAVFEIVVSLREEGFSADYRYTKTFINK